MPKQSIAPILALCWVALEVACYVLFLNSFGFLAALGVGVISTTLGLAALKRVGSRFSAMTAPGGFIRLAKGASTSLLTLIGAILLLAPGFGSDALGLLCLVASALGLAPRLRVNNPHEDVLDLSPGEWRRTPD